MKSLWNRLMVLIFRFDSSDLLTSIKRHDVSRTRRIAKLTRTQFEYVADDTGCPAMCLAAKEGSVEIINVLLKYGLNPHVPDDKCWFPIHFAAQSGKIDVICALVEGGHADVRRKCPVASCRCKKQSALHVAAEFGQYESALALLQYGSDVEATDFQQKTPAQVARDSGNKNIAFAIETFVKTHELSHNENIVRDKSVLEGGPKEDM